MTKTQFTKALDELGLGPASQLTARVLGITVRQVQRLAHGQQTVSEQTRLLLAMYAKHGIPKELRS